MPGSSTMLGWLSRQVDCSGSVLFRGTMAPRLQNLTQLAGAGVRVRPVAVADGFHWRADFEHPEWGSARVVCMRDFPPVPRALVAFDPRLSDEDKEAAASAGSAVSVTVKGSKKNVLRDRKLLLRYLRCLMGDDALMSLDHSGEKFWTRESLDDELSHDADLDIDSLFVTHMVHDEPPPGSDERPPPFWAHTHGLAELGVYDFDVLRPSPLLMGSGYDTFRAAAFNILEGKIGPGTDRFALIQPGGEVACVDVAIFNKQASESDRALRGDPDDPVHNQRRLILCEPRPRGLFAWFGSKRLRPSVFLSTVDNENMTATFTTAATDLMAERARKTFGLFRQFTQEFEEFEAKPLVKLGYQVDGGGPTEREHLWFEVHSCTSDSIEATLLNQPYHVSRMREGDRGQHDLELMTDWTIITPAGQITPREMVRARFIRDNREMLREIMQKMKAEDGP